MAKKQSNSPVENVPENLPQQGGSYTRQPDGSLARDEWTAELGEETSAVALRPVRDSGQPTTAQLPATTQE